MSHLLHITRVIDIIVLRLAQNVELSKARYGKVKSIDETLLCQLDYPTACCLRLLTSFVTLVHRRLWLSLTNLLPRRYQKGYRFVGRMPYWQLYERLFGMTIYLSAVH